MSKKPAKAPAAQPRTSGRSLEEFKATYDKDFIVPKKIREALAALGKGWAYETDFAKLAEVGLTDLGTYRSQFEDYVITLRQTHGGKRVWVGDKPTAAKMREML